MEHLTLTAELHIEEEGIENIKLKEVERRTLEVAIHG
jgi:hypothetical protein